MKKVRLLLVLCLVAVMTIGMALAVSADEVQYVWRVTLTGAPERIEAGQPITVPTLVDETGRVEVTAQWVDGQKNPVTATTFEDGKLYYLALTITPKDGYALEQEIVVELERIQEEFFTTTGTSATAHFRYSLQPKLNELAITGVPEVAVGQTAANPTIEVPTGANYSVTHTVWTEEDGRPFTGTFETGKSYYLRITLNVGSGYDFSIEEMGLTVNGQEPDWQKVWFGHSQTEMHITVVYSFKTVIPAVDITVPAPEVGKDINLDGIILPEHVKLDPYDLSYWQVDGENEPATGKFQQGKLYQLCLNIVPEAGYEFPRGQEDVITVNGTGLWELEHPWECWNGYTDGTYGRVGLSYSFLTQIDRVDITVPTPEAGKDINLDGIVLPEHVTINTEESYWTEQNPNYTPGEPEKATGKFQKGHKYYLVLLFHPEAGYEFADDTKVTMNGESPWDIYHENHGYASGSYGYLRAYYSLMDKISLVEITGVTDAVVGQTATTEGIQVTGATMNSANWYEGDSDTPFTGKFEAGKAYYLRVTFQAADGTEFTERCILKLNGEETNDGYVDSWENVGQLNLRYSFKSTVNKVEITGVTEAVVGQTATVEGIQITGGKLEQVYWMDEEDGRPFTGKFEAGKAYMLFMYLVPEDGKEYEYPYTVTVNGKETEYCYLGQEFGYAYLRFSFKTVIDKIELTGLPQFSVGGTASVEGLKTPEGANYTVEAIWNELDSDNDVTGTFAANKQYRLWVDVQPKDGYEFAEELEILIDGKAPQTQWISQGTDYVQIQYYFFPSGTVIDKVEIIAPTPVIGADISNEDIKAPAGAKYEVEGAWVVSSDGKNWTDATGKFEAGKYYALYAWIYADMDENIYLSDMVQIFVNGTAVSDEDMNEGNPANTSVLKEFGLLCEHTYGNWTSDGANTHSHTCTKCGDKVTENHVWENDKDGKCDTCGYVRSDNPPTGDAIGAICLLTLCSMAGLVITKRRFTR